MSDGKPLPFGGLPPRGGVTTDVPRKRTVASSASEPWSVLAIVSFAGSFVVSLVGIVCGYLALRQIRQTGQRGRSLALVGMLIGFVSLAITVAMVAVFLVGGSKLVASIAGVQTQAAVVAAAPHFSDKEKAAAEAAIASGGGAIPGHIVSAELCAAVKNFQAVSGAAAPTSGVTPEQLAAMESMAAVESPNQKTYQAFVSMTKDPSSVPSIDDAQKTAAGFAKAVQVDVTTCL
jgi:hypothetical protein